MNFPLIQQVSVKRKMLILLVLFANILNCLCQQYSWCDPQLCGGSKTVRHIACRNNGNFHRRCYPDASDVDISKFKHVFVNEHNKRRNLIASGQLPGYYPAARMATMVWDDELQYLAGLNVRTCKLDHDDCNHTYRFHNTGQNLCGISRLKSRYVNVTNLIDETITLWFDTEYDLIDSSFVDSFKVTRNFEAYGHFAEMIVDRIARVGCAIMRFTRPDYPHLYVYNVVCNYSSVYALGAPLYKTGYPGSGCKTGRNPRFPALCSEREDFDPNY
ncbi:antigen 5 like allergen Cul n 1-like [Lucilia sericata]|uniref:antigen 5 like allergen Cul n 1-like n=1 Tax=Lucilia sericata TaxID=13632 RepID=UPI0018A86520|nr:antigen 5 like allergen Cul n 1-like [Lucilia sericata]